MFEPTWDVVDEASAESFPASDPPAWGSWHASTNAWPRKRSWRPPLIIAGAVSLVALAVLAVRRRARRRRLS